MYAFVKTMAFFWTLAEGLILLYVRWGYLLLQRRRTGQPLFLAGFLALLLLSTLLLFGGEALLEGPLDLRKNLHRTLYRWGLWHFFCTLWVLLEGMIMVYVVRIYRLLCPLLRTGPGGPGPPVEPSPEGPLYAVPLLVLLFFDLYLVYDGHLAALVVKGQLPASGLYRLGLFYIRICGLFWILFEWVVALVGMKTYAAIKNLEDAP